MTTTNATPTPYESDPAYLDDEFGFLRARADRLAAERKAEDARVDEEEDGALAHRPGRIRSRDARCMARELLDDEKRLRGQIDARLAVHRADPTRSKLGLDILCDEHKLTTDERLVLVVATVPALSQRVSERILGALGSFYGAVSVADVTAVFAPTTPSDWLKLRKLFRPAAKLVRSGLVVLGPVPNVPGPDSLPSREVRLSMKAFSVVTGDPDATTEAEAADVKPS